MSADAHRCGAGHLCRDPHIDVVTGEREPAIIEEQRGLCKRCHGALRRAVCELVEDYERLSAAVEPDNASGGGIEHVSGTPEPSMPINGSALALRSTLSEWCVAALVLVAKPLGIKPYGRQNAKGETVHDYPPVGQAARVLPENIKALLSAPAGEMIVWVEGGTARQSKVLDGVDIAVKMMQTHWKVTALIGDTNPRRRLAMPCPVLECGAQTLGIANGETDVTCTTCGARWTEPYYNWLAGIAIAENKVREKASERTKFLLDLGKFLVAERDYQLKEVHRLATLTQEQLDGIDGWAVVQLLKEICNEHSETQRATTD